MDFQSLAVGSEVKDRWYQDWGTGEVKSLTKKTANILFKGRLGGEEITFDRTHVEEFLVPANESQFQWSEEGFWVGYLDRYPRDGKHRKCHTDMPCEIVYGCDTFSLDTTDGKMSQSNMWYVIWNYQIDIPCSRGFKTLSSAVETASKAYIKWLNKEKKVALKYLNIKNNEHQA